MAHILKVTTDSVSLQTSLQYDAPTDKVFAAIKLMLSASSNDVDFSNSSISLDWNLFKRNLIPLARILKSEGVEILPDSFSRSLIDRYLDDNNYLHGSNKYLSTSPKEIENILSRARFNRNLTKEQLRDVILLLSIKHGANFSVPGAGKTTTILAVHSVLNVLGVVDYLFVVSPINAFISWEDEVRVIFNNSKKIIRLSTDNFSNFIQIEKQKPDVILVNYEKMRKDIDKIYPFFLHSKIHLVLDESHRVKGGSANLSFQQIIKLADISVRRDILSGTPMPQGVADLIPQFDYLWSTNIIGEISDKSDKNTLISVNKKIKRYFVRTTKKELGLRDPIVEYKYIEMGPVQSELYKLFKSEAARILSGLEHESRNYYRNIGRSVVGLLQAATNPMLLGTDDEYHQETLPVPADSKAWQLLREFSKYEKAAKIEYLKKRVDLILSKNSKNKIVIWSYFVRNVKLLERIFSTYLPVSIYGAVPATATVDEDNRESRIRKFHNDPSCRLMIANPQAGGEGISLHRVCHYAIYLDRNFNAAHYLQSLDRIHRLGLEKTVDTHIEILIAKDTIDEVLIKRLNLKTKQMGKVLDDPGLEKLAYDPEDVIEQDSPLDAADISSIENHLLINNDKK